MAETKEKIVTKNTIIAEAIQMCPEALGIMFEHSLHCVGCHGSMYETIEQGALVHGKSEKDIEEIVKEINAAIKKNDVIKKTAPNK